MIRLRLLGESVIEVDGAPVAPDSQAIFATLLHLGLTRGTRLSRGALHRLLWPAAAEERGRHNLRQTLYKLRQLGVDLDTTPSSILLRPADVEGEVVAIARGEPLPAERVTRGRGLGEFLPGYAPAFSAPFAEWVEEQRAVVHGQLRRALLATMLEQRQRGAWREVELIARQVLQYDALNEEATLALAEAAAMSGGKAQALGILDRYLEEIGGDAGDIRLPATVLRRRIAERLPQHAYASEGDDCFVGREESIALLMEMYRRAKEGRGGAVLIWGEPGIGKTRLLEEFGKMVVLEGDAVQARRLQQLDQHRPFALFRDLVPHLQDMPGSLGIAETSVSALRSLSTIEATELQNGADPLEAQAHLARIRKAVTDLFDAVLDESPLIITVDDSQWLDAQSATLLRELLVFAERARLLVIAASRTDRTPLIATSRDSSPVFRFHPLCALGEDDARTVLLRSAGASRWKLDDEYLSWCVTTAEGNPFFLKELGTPRHTVSAARTLPSSLAAVLECRLHSLSTSALRVMQLLGLLNTDVPFSLVQDILGLDSAALLASVDELAEHRLLAQHATGLKPRHDLLARAATQRLHHVTRKLLHERCAQVLLSRAGDAPPVALLQQCADHYGHAGQAGAAVALLLRLARHLSHMGLPEESVQASRAADEMADDRQQRIAALLERTRTYRAYSQWSQALSSLASLEGIATSDPALCDQVALYRAEAEWSLRGDVEATLLRLRTLRDSHHLTPDERATAHTLGLVVADNACNADLCSDFYHALARMQERAVAEPPHDTVPEIIFHCSYGDLDKSVEAARRLFHEERAHLHVRFRRRIAACVIPLWRSGLVREALEVSEHFYDAAEHRQIGTSAMYAAGFMSSIAFDLGDFDKACAWYARAREWSRFEADTYMNEGLQLLGVNCLLAVGDISGASALGLRPHTSWLTDSFVRRRCERIAAWLNLCLATQACCDETLIESLQAAFASARKFGGQDKAATALYRWMRARSAEQADRFIDEYLSVRRDRFPLLGLK